jgi:uncharacterized tellurite resistance protein B-like protein
VAQAVLSDAQVTDAERQFLDKLMDGYELDPTQRKDVLKRNLGDDPAALLEGFADDEAKKELLRELARAVATDGVFAAAEEQLLARVGGTLGIAPDEIERLVADAVD